ncbi:MAG: YicC family protein [Chitinophagaceae bacterium]
MIFSMTGYGSYSTVLSSNLSFKIELFSVNGKGLTVNIKSSIFDKLKELQIKDKITEHLKRGTVECSLYLEKDKKKNTHFIQEKIFGQFIQEITDLGKIYHFKKELLLPYFFHVPNIFQQKQIFSLEEEEHIFLAIDQAIKNILDYRKKEGNKLKEDFHKQLDFILQERLKILAIEPQRKQKVKDNLLKELQNLTPIDENRFHQELVYYIEKMDIHEELTRLEIHCNYLKNFLEEKNIDYKGKKIGFILQEILREINTLGAKANIVEIQQIVINLKDVIEKMKEQSLNIL